MQFLTTANATILLASRAIGEQGIVAFLLGDIGTANKDVLVAGAGLDRTRPGRKIPASTVLSSISLTRLFP